jgi:hypothetical protein
LRQREREKKKKKKAKNGIQIRSILILNLVLAFRFYALIMIFTAVLAWRTRGVHSAFRESTFIFVAGGVLFIVIFFFPTLSLLSMTLTSVA